MPLILGTNSIKDTGFNVANSCRFNDDDSPRMHRTPGSAGNLTTWTLSMWVKRSTLGGEQLVAHGYADSNNHTEIMFEGDNTFTFRNKSSGSFDIQKRTNMLFRDLSTWYNLVIVNKPSAQKLFINGAEPTYQTDVKGNYSTTWNNANENSINSASGSRYFDGYISEVVFLDGTAVDDATSFGEFDQDSGIWKPIDVSGLTFGTNGFYLDFEDSSSLGNDAAGSNNFTVNNLTATDQSTDTCTNNFATLNPLYKQDHVFSEGNLDYTSSDSDWDSGLSTIGASSGKYYIETKITGTASGVTRTMFGLTDVRNGNEVAEDRFISNFSNGDTVGYYNGSMYKNGSSVSGSWSTYGINDILGMYVDLDNHYVYFSKNGAMQNSGDPTSGSSGTGGVSFATGETYIFGVTTYGGGANQMNFGSPPYAVSSGNQDPNGYGNFEYSTQNYYSLNTKNLAEYG